MRQLGFKLNDISRPRSTQSVQAKDLEKRNMLETGRPVNRVLAHGRKMVRGPYATRCAIRRDRGWKCAPNREGRDGYIEIVSNYLFAIASLYRASLTSALPHGRSQGNRLRRYDGATIREETLDRNRLELVTLLRDNIQRVSPFQLHAGGNQYGAYGTGCTTLLAYDLADISRSDTETVKNPILLRD